MKILKIDQIVFKNQKAGLASFATLIITIINLFIFYFYEKKSGEFDLKIYIISLSYNVQNNLKYSVKTLVINSIRQHSV